MDKRRVLASVTDKAGIEKLLVLALNGWEIISTGGTAITLGQAEVPCTLIEQVTGFPEMMNGRLKTLHPNVFGGILADRNKPEHLEAIAGHGIRLIDVVVVNLYDFNKEPGIENIDIGGPSLLRAAAKNHESVTVIVDPADYDKVIYQILEKGDTTVNFRRELAAKVFDHTATYDRMIHDWLSGKTASGPHPSHKLRFSDSSVCDYVCENCGASDQVPGGWGYLTFPCSNPQGANA